MATRKRKKSRKLRGRTRTMGWGRVGQHRKSGSRGGFGAVGMHKHKWIWVLKYAPDWYGKRGFRSRGKVAEPVAINVGVLDEIAAKLVKEGKAAIEGEKIVVDLVKLGIDKLMGSGKITRKVKVVVKEATEKAKEKIMRAGGEVVIAGQEGHAS